MLKQLDDMLDGFVRDPADSDYQRGFLAALMEVRKLITTSDHPELLTLHRQRRAGE